MQNHKIKYVKSTENSIKARKQHTQEIQYVQYM